jgi:hypothetical protein
LAPIEIQRPVEEVTEEFDYAQSLKPEPHGPILEDALTRAYLKDPFPNQVLEILRSGTRYCKDILLAEYSEVKGRLYYRNKLYVPNSYKLCIHLCKEHHNHPVTGHPGVTKTFNLIRREYYWLKFYTFIQRYVNHCDVCRQTKSCRHRRYGVLKPLPVPDRR